MRDSDLHLGIGQVVDLGFGDVAARADGVPLQLAPTQRLGQGGPAERTPDWNCSASRCMRCQSAGSAAARVAMRHQPERNSSSAAKSTTGARVIASSSVSNAATLAAGKAAYGGEGPLDVRMEPVVSLDGHDDA